MHVNMSLSLVKKEVHFILIFRTHSTLHVRLIVTTDIVKASKHELHVERPTLTLSCTVCHPVCAGHLLAFVI